MQEEDFERVCKLQLCVVQAPQQILALSEDEEEGFVAVLISALQGLLSTKEKVHIVTFKLSVKCTRALRTAPHQVHQLLEYQLLPEDLAKLPVHLLAGIIHARDFQCSFSYIYKVDLN